MLILFKPSFVREFKKLPAELREEAFLRIELFKDPTNHQSLKVHKLKGRLKDFYSFSVTYSHRIVFMYQNKDTVVFLAIGDHSIYK